MSIPSKGKIYYTATRPDQLLGPESLIFGE